MKTYCGSGGITAWIFYLGTRWRRVVRSTPQPLYLQGKSPRYPLHRRLGGTQSRSGRCDEEKNSQSLPGLEHRSSSPQPPNLGHLPVTIPTDIIRFTTSAFSTRPKFWCIIKYRIHTEWYLVKHTMVKIHFTLRLKSVLPPTLPSLKSTLTLPLRDIFWEADSPSACQKIPLLLSNS
jgi:hypothetical protein